MKKLISLFLILCFITAAFVSCGAPDSSGGDENPDGDENSQPPVSDASEYAAERDITGRNIAYVTLKIRNYGSIKLLLDATSAPITVGNFLSLAKSGFYDGLTFHLAQELGDASLIIGGDPYGNGEGGSDECILGEFSENGYENNDLSHKRGVISMFHSQYSYNDASSQFFIANGDLSDAIDGLYAPFGYVVDGLSVLEKITNAGLKYTESTGLITKNRQPTIQSVTVEKDIDYSLIKDAYIAPPELSELEAALDEDGMPDRITAGYADASVLRAYANDYGYAFQFCLESDSSFTNLLVSVNKNLTVREIIQLPLSETAELFEPYIYSLTGLDIDGLNSRTDLPDELHKCLSNALRAAEAAAADGKDSSKYVYTRDTEGRDIYYAELKIKGYDSPVIILLDGTTAPLTVSNFVSLVKAGFYDGLDFHRIIKGFMIQGGDDSALPEDEQAASIKGEFASNGHYNDILHIRGVISMARTSEPNSASCQFFICDADSHHLDGSYAAFGYVISGMDTVDAVADYSVGKTNTQSGNFLEGIEKPLIEYIKIIENYG